jgi:FkbM family methyltransferase
MSQALNKLRTIDQKLIAKRGMTGATGNTYVGLHEFTDMMFLLHFLRRGDVFLDIAANVGTYSVLASGVCKGTSHAFKPDPSALAALRRNVEINNLQDLVMVHGVAVGATNREVAFTIGLDAANRVTARRTGIIGWCSKNSLNSIIGNVGPSFAKLDVQGHEEEVLRGAWNILANESLHARQWLWSEQFCCKAPRSVNIGSVRRAKIPII